MDLFLTHSRPLQMSTITGNTLTPSLEVKCGDLQHPDNGSVEAPDKSVDSIATYRCNTNYKLSGRSKRTCNLDDDGTNAEWNDTAPTCVGKS